MKSGRDAEPGRRPLATGRSLRCILFPHGFASDDIRHLRRRQHGALMQFIVEQHAERMRDNCELIVRHPAHLGERVQRSEEHTSELQSLMRISYAVFCLKKKKKKIVHKVTDMLQ